MTKLTKKEKQVLPVMIDLFLKGSPEHRIALYMLNQKMTENQALKFLQKLNSVLGGTVMNTIWYKFQNLSRNPHFHDDSKNYGYTLENWRVLNTDADWQYK